MDTYLAPHVSDDARARAAAHLAAICDDLGVAPVTRVDPRRSVDILWFVTAPSGWSGVLKLYVQQEGDEAAVLRAWADAGVASASVVAAASDPHPYMLTEFLDADPTPPAAAAGWFTPALELARRAHEVDVPRGLPDLADLADRKVSWALSQLDASGFDLPSHAELKGMLAGYAPVLAHLSYKPANVLSVHGRLHLVGALGASGPAARDAGWWAVHACDNATDLLELDRWARQAAAICDLDPADVLTHAAVKLVVHAGFADRHPQRTADETAALLAAARRVLRW